jgi:hypothetical protein
LNESYEAWNRALAGRFFRPEYANRPVYLSADDEEIEELADTVGVEEQEALDSFVTAVRREFSSSLTYGLYEGFLKARREWRKSGAQGPPPYAALLALTVLAGSHMARDPVAGVASHNYYVRYNELIGRPPDGGQPPGFDGLQSLWEDLDRWLQEDCGERLGRSTVRPHPTLSHVGYPISQCLLREADRRRLTEFFRAAELEPGDEINAAELFTLLRSWARPGCGLSSPAIGVIEAASDSVAEEIAELVKGEFGAWGGELLDERGRRRAEVALVLEVKQGGHWIKASFWPRRPEGFPAQLEVAPRSGERVRMQAVSPAWYGPLAAEVRNRDLEKGLVLEGEDFSLAYQPARVVPLRASEDLGRWVAVRQVRAAEPHCVVSHTAVLDAVRGFLGDHAEPGWRELPGTGNLPEGWRVFDSVTISSPASPQEAHLRPLAPRFGTTSRLEGGLRVGRGQYLTGGEPDLWITVAEGDRPAVVLDGEPLAVEERIARLRLSEQGLDPGEHRIEIGGLTRHFTTSAGFPVAAPSGAGSLGHVLRRGRGYAPLAAGPQLLPGGEQEAGTVRVSGAAARAREEDLPAPLEPPILLPAGFRSYTVIGRVPGEVLEVTQPRRPAWLAPAGLGDQFQYFDQVTPFEAQWLIAGGSSGTRVRAIRHPPLPPAAQDGADPEMVAAWCAAASRGAAGSRRAEDEEAFGWYAARARELEGA